MTPAQQAGILRATGAEVVVVHHQFGDGAAMAAYLESLFGAPVYRDGRVAIFGVAEGPLPETPVYTAQGGWAADGGGSRWMADALTLSVYVPQNMDGYWTFDAAGWLYPRWISLAADGLPPEAFYVPAEGQPSEFRQMAARLHTGFQQVRFSAPDFPEQCTRLPGEPACRTAWIRTPRLHFGDEDQARVVDFGAKMRLVRYGITAADPAHLALTFYWQALDRQRADYTLFVHLLDEGGALVAQWDGPLGGVDNPTSRWPQGGYLWQAVELDLTGSDLKPGRYTLAAGLYTLPDVVRLPVTGDSRGARDGLLYLREWVIPPS